MKKTAFIFLSLLLLFTQCCRIINIVGVRTHFERDLSEAEKQKVVWTTEDKSICDLENDSLVYAVSGEQLKNCITQYDKVLVYYWDPHCSADACHPLSAMQYFCDEHGMEFFVVTEYFWDCFSQIGSLKSHPLLVANERHYGTDKCRKLDELFFTDLIGKENYGKNKEISWYRYLYFEHGDFVKYVNDPFEEF